MKYVSLLRGINVGGNNIIKMIELKDTVEKAGFTNVVTYIQSGNVIFDSEKKSIEEITKILEDILVRRFDYLISVVVKSQEDLEKILANVPEEWIKDNDLRCYIAFIKTGISKQNFANEVEVKPGVDYIKLGEGVLYMSTKLNGITPSGFTRLISKKIYKQITMRNYNTSQKILTLMEK